MLKFSGLLLVATAAIGCTPKALPSYKSATVPNPPPGHYKDAYAYGGIANGSGGRATKVSHGAGAEGVRDGASELYLALTGDKLAERHASSSFDLFLVPDPTAGNKLDPYLASVYLQQGGIPYSLGPIASDGYGGTKP